MIGAGQAGLAIGSFLKQQGRQFVILDSADSIGAAWRTRWESLTLFTPRRYSGLPGLPFPGDPEGYPSRDEVIAYLEQYAQTFDLPIELNSRVRRLSSEGGRFLLEVDGRTITADQVVVATGPFQMPFVPAFASRLAPDVFQAHSTEYRKPSDVPDGTVLVVGGGNTGFQIAKELAATHKVSRGRLAPDAAPTEIPRPRSVLVADEDGSAQQDGRVPAGAQAATSGHAHRIEPARAAAAVWGRVEAEGGGCLGAHGSLRGWERT